MLIASLGVVIGLAMLSVAADQFVIGAVRISVKAHLSPVIVGAVVLGFGTSLPELVVSALASVQNAADLAVANVIGSNSANLALGLGIAALITTMDIPDTVKRRELPIALVTSVLFAAAIQRPLHVAIGVGLALVFAVCLTLMIVLSKDDHPGSFDTFASSTNYTYLRLIGGLAATLVGAQILIASARTIATELGLAEGFVGVTIVAIGTSLPELATTVAAARRRQAALIVGNLLGSNLFNATAVGAVAVIFAPGAVIAPEIAGIATVLMLTVTAIVAVLSVVFHRVSRATGIVLIGAYVVTLPLLY